MSKIILYPFQQEKMREFDNIITDFKVSECI